MLTNASLFSQNYFSIKGHITDADTNVNITDCFVNLFSSSAISINTKSDSLGLYSIDSIPVKNDAYEITIIKNGFFDSRKKINFSGLGHDTVVDFEMVHIIAEYYFLPDIHFQKNSSKPERNFKDTLSYILEILQTNPFIKIEIVGHKDSLESSDKRQDRAQCIFDELVKSGISKDQLSIEISNEPCFCFTGEKDYNTAARKTIIYTENYIKTFPKTVQKDLRKRNQCVSFKMKMK